MKQCLLCVATLIALSVSSTQIARVLSAQLTNEPIDFQIMAQSNARDGKHVSIAVLVPPTSRKSDVIALAGTLKTKHKIGATTVFVEIWNSKEAYLNRLNDNYPFCKMIVHKLVEATYNSQNSYDEIEWVPDKWAGEISKCRAE